MKSSLIIITSGLFKLFLASCICMIAVYGVKAQCPTTVSSFPYTEDFEGSDGGWISGGTGSDWAWGMPGKSVISSAGSGQKCWITGGLSGGSYTAGERSFLQSPCFNFTNITNPYISFLVFWETEKQYDGANLQYSINGGSTWSNIGSTSDLTGCLNDNWFNNASITNLSGLVTLKEGWSGNIQATSGNCLGGSGSNGWVKAKHTMPYLGGEPQVIFRFTFGSGTTCNYYDGFAFDSLVIMEAPPVPVIAYQSVPAGCEPADGSISLQVTGGPAPFTYNWTPGVSITYFADSLTAGTYTIEVTDANGCTSSIRARVPTSPSVSVILQSSPDTCFQGKGRAEVAASGGTPPFSFVWNSGVTASVIENSLPGTYIVTVTDNRGCTASEQVAISDTGYFDITLGPDLVICGTAIVPLNVGSFDHYEWSDGSNSPSFTVTRAGTYSVVVWQDNGCKATDTLVVSENCLDGIVLPNAFTPNGDGINEIFKPAGNGITTFRMQIRNRWGSIVFEGNSPESGWDGKSNGNPSPSGIYVWEAAYSIGSSAPGEKSGTVLLIR